MLRQVPCRVVYDVKLDQPSLINLETRRCGIKFGPLSPPQRQLLKQVLASHAGCRLPDSPPPDPGSLPGTSPPTA